MKGNGEKYIENIKGEITFEANQLKVFFEIPLSLLCIFDNSGKILELNPAWEDVLGYKIEDMLGRNAFEFVHPDDVENTGEIYKSIVNDSVSKYINRIRCFDGSYRTIEWRVVPYGDYILAAAADITKNVQIEKTLREKEDRYEKLVANMSDGLWVIERNGRFYDVNNSAQSAIGYNREELLKMTVFDIDPTISSEKFSQIYDYIVENGSYVYHGIHVRKDGNTYDVEVNSGIIEFDGIQYILCTTRDISDRKRAEMAIIESERKFRTVVDQSSDAIFVCSMNGMIEDMNRAACENFYYETYELLNTNIHNLVLDIKNSSRKHGLSHVNDAVTVMTEHFKRKDGSSFIGDARTRTIEIDNIKHLLVVIRDITEQQENEEKIKFLSFHDSLTCLYNRTFLEEEIKRLDTNRQLPISFIMGDVNGLKLTNDVFGHHEGDELLKTIANIIKGSCRSEDIVARWGGDEYMIMLPCTGEKRAEEISREIKKKCRDYKKIAGNDVIEPSISLGYATKMTSDENINHVIKKAEDIMYRKKLVESRSVHNSLIASMRSTLYEKSFETEEHVVRINRICKKIGYIIGLSDEMMNELDLFSMLHDIGKVAIEEHLLNKKEKLTEDEWNSIKRHSEIGYRIAKSVPELNSISEYILCHHERWDGKGYPQCISKDQIPLLSRILSVADSYVSMTQDRPYRKALSKEDAIEELIKGSGKQFDPEIVNIFLSKVIREL